MVDVAFVGLLLVLAGVLLVVVGLFRAGRRGGSDVKGGGVVLIGPIPIVFGSDAKWASVAIGLAIVLIALALVFFLVRV